MKNNTYYYLILCFLLSLIVIKRTIAQTQTTTEYGIAVLGLESCDETDVFDIQTYSCITCPNGTVAKTNRMGCECPAGHTQYQYATQGNTALSGILSLELGCTNCTLANKAPSRDKSICMDCDGTTATLDGNLGDCACTNTSGLYYLIEKDNTGYLAAKQCIECPYPVKDRYTCEAPASANCGTGVYCNIDNELSACMNSTTCDRLKAIRNRRVYSQITSLYYLEHFYSVLTKCQGIRDEQACQHLANLCVASLYTTSSEVPACEVFIETHEELMKSTTNQVNQFGITGWVAGFPFLYFDASVTETTYVNSEAITAPVIVPTRLRFILATFSLNGTFLGYEELSNQLVLCDSDELHTTDWLSFGVNYNHYCQLNLYHFFQRADPKDRFYELFYVNATNTLYPVAVKMINGDTNTQIVMSQKTLFRRFFTIESEVFAHETDDSKRTITYASSMVMSINLRGSDAMSPPLLTITYRRQTANNILQPDSAYTSYSNMTQFPIYEAIQSPTVSFTAAYTTNHWIEYIIVGSFLLLVVILATLLFIIRVWQFTLNKMNLGPIGLLQLVEVFCNIYGRALFVVLFFTCQLYYWIFKNQRNVLVVIPTRVDLIAFYICILVGVLLKCIEIICMTIRSTQIDIFFIDWEKTKGRILEKGGRARGNAQISIWRTIYLAKAWKKLILKRIVSVESTIFVLILFFCGFRLIQLANPEIGYTLDLDRESNPILRFALVSLIWFIWWLIQYIFSVHFIHRYIKNPYTSFIDLCSVCNISLLVLTDSTYGYYIHGESVHEYSDTNMHEFHRNLNWERQNKVLDRGFIPDEHADLQTFECHFSTKFRETYNQKILIPLNEEKMHARNLARYASSNDSNDSHAHTEDNNPFRFFHSIVNYNWQKYSMDRLYPAYVSTNTFLKDFFNHVRMNPSNSVIDKTLSYRLGFSPKAYYPYKGLDLDLMVRDTAKSFKDITMGGIEFTMFEFNMFLWSAFDMLFGETNSWFTTLQSSVIAFIVVWLTNILFLLIRKYLSHWNTARKTMLDQRFL
mmetsp:Transcript_576/g.970  ORF Transcript_576/g.970 Transcript_576/m.970 type:complete len:1032 (-) Transcript_576:28-3123(-)